ncbi:MAG: peptidylprolyl isomerase [Ruminococcus sp.]|nr:peptidylprolyl isomerase [Ruminococcus sp.]
MNKNKNKVAMQLGVMVVCFLLILALALFLGRMNRKNKPDYDNAQLLQTQVPSDSTPVAVFETSMGTFKAVIYEDKAPDLCKYFTGLVNKGYYDGTYVFSVEKDAYFIGGSKSKSGEDTSDTDTKTITKETNAELWPFKGSLISFGGSDGKFFSSNVSGSRIMFVGSIEFTDEIVSEMDKRPGNSEINEVFKRWGGVPNFSQQYTIFGQVYDGYESYEKICAQGKGDSSDTTPTTEIKINNVYMSTYGENKNDSFFTEKLGSSSK